jgi:hypothetical protein
MVKWNNNFPTDLQISNSMMDVTNLTPSQRQQHRQDAIKYASIMLNISIRDGQSTYENKHMVKFGRIGYMTNGNTLKNKYKPRSIKVMMIGMQMITVQIHIKW